jgi:hypothetical protein
MRRLHVEGWAPEYGSPFAADDGLAEPGKVDETVEADGIWRPIDGVDDGIRHVAFIDGVRRVDARLTVDTEDGPVAGICGTFAVGAVCWDRSAPRSDIDRIRIDRLAVFGHGIAVPVPVAGASLSYRSESVADVDPQALIQHFHGRMRKAEAVMSEAVAQEGTFVIADGPINDLSATEKVGYIKTHRAPYLSAEANAIVATLRAGQRTPLFLIGRTGPYPRYSWYLRLAEISGGHSWTGVVRAEVSSHLPLDVARRVADRTTALLPLVASQPHVDPRAPQNLVPIGALERTLRRRMGDPTFIHRALRSAVGRVAQAGDADLETVA